MPLPSLKMVDILPGINTTVFGEIVWGTMPPGILDNFTFLLNIAKAVGVLFIIYLAFLILKALVQTRQALRIKSIELHIASIDQKLDRILQHKKESSHDKGKKEK